MFCPYDSRPCMDDLCHGGDCIRTGSSMLVRCAECGQLFEECLSDVCEDCEGWIDDDDEPDHESLSYEPA